MSCCTTPLVGDTYDEDTIGILEAAHRLALEQILLLVREEIVLRGAFVIPFPGPGEIPFALALLCALTAFGPRTVFTFGSYPIGWFDLAAVVLALGGLIDLTATVIRLYRQLPGPVRP